MCRFNQHLKVCLILGAFLFLALPVYAAVPTSAAPASFADLAAKLTPAVVNISTVQNIDQDKVPKEQLPQFPEGSPFDDFFKEFFDRHGVSPDNQPRQLRSLGSAFVIDAEKGLIVTNNHVIQDADEVHVTFHDGDEIEAKIIGQDPTTDLALLKITTKKKLTAVPFGKSDDMRVGDWILAIGNPFGLGGTVTAGIISARARDIHAGPYIDFLQTDASINRGNSGGPMFNMKGEVVGINTALVSPTGGSVGIGFAIPADSARFVISQLEKFGRTKRGWLGAHVQQVTEEIAESLGLKKASGMLVGRVMPKSPSAAAGVKSGDIILKFNNQDITDSRQFQRLVAETDINKKVPVLIWRKGQEMTLSVTIGEREKAEEDGLLNEEQPKPVVDSVTIQALGAQASELTKSLRAKYQIDPTSQGVVITKLLEKSPLIDKGVKAGDLIVEVAQSSVTKPADIVQQLANVKKSGRNSVLLLIDRKGTLQYIAVTIK